MMFQFRVCGLATVLLVLAGCAAPMTAEQQSAADRASCTGDGFSPGTERFAQCMMQISDRRQVSNGLDQRLKESTRQQSIQRNGDARFPVCSAATPDASPDPSNHKWYAPNCREQ